MCNWQSEGTGDIATCSEQTVRVWSINGALLATVVTSQINANTITACTWSKVCLCESRLITLFNLANTKYLLQAEVSPLLLTGHESGRIIFWQRRSLHAENPSNCRCSNSVDTLISEKLDCILRLFFMHFFALNEAELAWHMQLVHAVQQEPGQHNFIDSAAICHELLIRS